MPPARFWYVPVKHVCGDEAARTALLDAKLADETLLDTFAAHKLLTRGVKPGDLLALMDGTAARKLARVLTLDRNHVRWHQLPLEDGPPLGSAPALDEVPAHEAVQFKVGVAAMLSDTSRPVPLPVPLLAKPQNIILYGPPGTGKTYSLKERALALALGEGVGDSDAEKAEQWEALQAAGQIAMCTFHQAYTYEEFVEGLRARTDEEGRIYYRVEDGLFKKMALEAAADGLPDDDVEVGFDDLWGDLVDSLRAEPRIAESLKKMKYQLEAAPRGGIMVRGGDVDEDGAFEPNGKWLSANQESMRALWEKRRQLGQAPSTAQIGQSAKGHATAMWMVYRELLVMQASEQSRPNQASHVQRALSSGRKLIFPPGCRQYVLIVDEINRANIARVMGELITLLEPEKRLTGDDELRLHLPASGERFGVPPNLHIIGTMNTADRSIALMDIALRRRFTFEEMQPSAKVIKEVLGAKTADKQVHPAIIELIVQLFERINDRLRYLYDREHQIGHAYFLKVRTLDNLRETMALKVLPLLQEYFFGQWEKLAMVLGYPVNSEGTPKQYRSKDEDVPTVLVARKLVETEILGFSHDQYIDQVAWEVHPAFQAKGDHDFGDDKELWLARALCEVAFGPGRDTAAKNLIDKLNAGEG
ncbi:MAG: AAA family ATPase [Myxococcota bacterium]